MGTTSKSLQLLDHFSTTRPEIGLSSLARMSGRNKAAVHRSLVELLNLGFVEQNKHTRLYRLGPTIIRLANVREATVPINQAVSGPLTQLVDAVHETAHVTLLQGNQLVVAGFCQSRHHGTRVEIEPSEVLPLHATASGSAILAFSEASLIEEVLSQPLPAVTNGTLTEPQHVREKTALAEATGFGRSDGEYESDVCSVAAPIFGPSEDCIGAVSVAFPRSRSSDALQTTIKENLKPAAKAISLACGGEIPASLDEIWRQNEPN